MRSVRHRLGRPLSFALLLLVGTAAQAAEAPAWAQVQLNGRITLAEQWSAGPMGFDVASWQGQAFSLRLTLPEAVQQSGQLPVDDIPGAVSARWQMAWIDSALQLGPGDRHAGRARSFQGVELTDEVTVPAGLQLGGRPLTAGHAHDLLLVWASELSGRCVHPGTDGVCSGFRNPNDAPLGGDDPINAIFDPTEVWQGLTVEWTHVWDTTEQQGFSGLAFPALRPGGLDLGQGWGVVSITVWQVTGDASGAPVSMTVAEALGPVQLATLQPVPEPASAALLALGLGLLTRIAGRRRR